MKYIVGRKTGAQQKVTKAYICAFDRVIQPTLDKFAMTQNMQNIAHMMKTPNELMTFLLCLKLFKEGTIFLTRKTENYVSATF